MHAAYGTVTLYKSSWWPVDTQLEWELTGGGRLLVGRLKTPYQQQFDSLKQILLDFQITYTVGPRFATVSFTTIHFYDSCRVGPNTPDLRCITLATQASQLHLLRF